MSEEVDRKKWKKFVEFPSEITCTKQRYYIHVPVKYIKFNQVNPNKKYKVILIPIEDQPLPQDS
jgi:hypothetical protein